MFLNLKIAARLWLGFTAIALILVGAVGVSAWKVGSIEPASTGS